MVVQGSEQGPIGESGHQSVHGTTVADDRHVSVAEAEAALNTDQAQDELPPEDPGFQEDAEVFDEPAPGEPAAQLGEPASPQPAGVEGPPSAGVEGEFAGELPEDPGFHEEIEGAPEAG